MRRHARSIASRGCSADRLVSTWKLRPPEKLRFFSNDRYASAFPSYIEVIFHRMRLIPQILRYIQR
jgi:hypothetical protein